MKPTFCAYALLWLSSARVLAQCSTVWQIGPGFGFGSLPYEASVACLRTLPGDQLVAGGFFEAAGATPCNSIARWDGAAWRAMGTGIWNASQIMVGRVHAVTVLANGDLVAGGDFTHAGGHAANNVARWDGATWHPIGSGLDGPVNALVTLDNGDLIVGGLFAHAGGQAVANIARWDGVNWFPLGPGLDGEVRTLLQHSDGDLVIGGDFFGVGGGGFNMTFVARWRGSSWYSFNESLDWWGTSLIPGVHALAELPNGDIVVGGDDIRTSIGTIGIAQ